MERSKSFYRMKSLNLSGIALLFLLDRSLQSARAREAIALSSVKSTIAKLDSEAAAGIDPSDSFSRIGTDHATRSALKTSGVVEADASFLHRVQTSRARIGAGLAGAGLTDLLIHFYVSMLVVDGKLIEAQELFDAHRFHSHLAPFQPLMASPVRLKRFFLTCLRTLLRR